MMHTLIGNAATDLAAAVECLRAGELVAFPTETVYGLGADATSDSAVGKIYEAKGRPITNPSIVHASDVAMARECVAAFPQMAEKLAAAFWPGPLTIVLERSTTMSPLVSAGRNTVAVRVPKHPIATALLKAFGKPIAAPSANRSGFVSPTSAAHVLAELEGRVPLILDGGPSDIGVESTVLDLTRQPPVILRPGAVTAEMLREVLGEVQVYSGSVKPNESAASPGLLARHYAPRTRAIRFAAAEWPRIRAHYADGKPAALVTFDRSISLPAPHSTILVPDSDAGYARSIYAALRDADEARANVILVLLPPAGDGLWPAIHDRLRRATIIEDAAAK